ncbi:uncharacterized protein LAJ45_10361 [Morchella importuna]|uniref:uncharacterized protein n=1 Tax=Morchella importuna TaxID=1174673 RepID=UPI001E8E63A9|nr:uncharacterized protein LAJ45_10361 [Morchella importuna]KAH8145561.1 hypothetical protein LAJ45_10361 [Morchella importuna]
MIAVRGLTLTTDILIKDHHPQRSISLVTQSHALIFRHSPSLEKHTGDHTSPHNSYASIGDKNNGSSSANAPRCMVELVELEHADLSDYRRLTNQPCLGAKEVASVRPGENVLRIQAVQFHCLNRTDYDDFLDNEVNPYSVDSDGWDQGRSQQPVGLEHPCLALKKLLSDGTFYYSRDFDLTNRLQDRSLDTNNFDIDNFDDAFLWNSYMIQPLLKFRSRLSESERTALDNSNILTSTIRGFVESLLIPRPSTQMEGRMRSSGLPATLTLISRLSCRRAGTRFNSRGIDDDGHVANFVETETVVWDPGSNGRSLGFSYCQIRGSIPIFWEQQAGLLPGQQKVQITRSPEATQPAFDKHMETITLKYGATHIVNLLSETKPGEVELSNRYMKHISKSPFDNGQRRADRSESSLLISTEFDFHAETKGPGGFEAANRIRQFIQSSADSFSFFLMENVDVKARGQSHDDQEVYEAEKKRGADSVVLQQEGVFRTNCLDCLDRTNLVQGIFSRMAIEAFLEHLNHNVGQEFWMRHSSLWADNGDALSKIYAGTGALKSSFTRTGKMSIAGAFADARKSATRIYINNFADKDRQNTIDVLLGRLVGQEAAYLYDPINDYVMAELNKRSPEYSYDKPINIYVGTFNLNGRINGSEDDLSGWLCPPFEGAELQPELVVVGFQEIVELSPQQIMATTPEKRQIWERAVKKTLNRRSKKLGGEEYILLRGGQLVGAALLIFVRSSAIGDIKNVEGSLKKTGMSGVAGNKGAVAIRMDYANTGICFVTAHLAAGFSNYDERNRDYKTISHGLRFSRGRAIDDHDAVIWLGDFNYRIGLTRERVLQAVEHDDLQTLRKHDQLNIQMEAGLTFPYYSEAKLSFPPTYKYDIGTDNYDTSEKARIPAWCDRVLKKGNALRQLSYNCAPLRFSDHRPVYATFQCTVSVVNETVRDKMSREIYLKRKSEVGKSGSHSGNLIEDEDDLLDFEPLEPGLPPPSSEQRKWWLDNGIKSVHRNIPNFKFEQHDFHCTIKDWTSKAPAAVQSDRPSIAPAETTCPSGARQAKISCTPPVAPRKGAPEIPMSSHPSTAKPPKQAPPAIPRKPAVLSSRAHQESPSLLDQDVPLPRNNLTGGPAPTRDVTPSMRFPPPPRRVGTTPMPLPMGNTLARSYTFRDDTRVSNPNPALPPRRQDAKARSVMDEDELPTMSSWQPLRPA